MKLTSNDDFFLGMMDVRKQSLNQMYEAYSTYNVDYIGYSQELKQYFPYSTSDDPGIYSIVSHLGSLFGAKDIFLVYQWFSFFAIFAASIFAFWGLIKLIDKKDANRLFKIISFLAVICISIFVSIKSDVYTFYYIALCPIPFLYWSFTHQKNPNWLLICASISIMIISEYCRSQSGLIGFVFIILGAFVLANYNFINKILIVFLLMLSFLLFKKYVNYKSEKATEWLILNEKNYDVNENNHHPYWHSIYIGLGYIENKYKIIYSDSIAIREVAKVNDKCLYGSDEYEKIIRDKYFELLKSDPMFFIKSYTAKAFTIMLYLILFTFPILIFKMTEWKEIIVFGASIAYASLGAFLVFPRINYLIPCIVLSIFYTLIMYNKKRKLNSISPY